MVELTKEEAEVLSALIDSGLEKRLWNKTFDYWVLHLQSKLNTANQPAINPQIEIPGLSMMG